MHYKHQVLEEISWLCGNKFLNDICNFQEFYGLPIVEGAIDGTHFNIKKTTFGVEDYYYFKMEGYSMKCQALVNCNKKFIDISIGMFGSTNDFHVLKRSSLYHLGTTTNMFDVAYSQEGFSPYLLENKGSPLCLWLLVLYWNLLERNKSINKWF